MDEHYDDHYDGKIEDEGPPWRIMEDGECCPEIEEEQLPERKRPFVFKLTAVIVLIAFSALALGNVLPIFALPSLDFIIESRRLSREPLVRELQEAVVQVRVTTPDKNNVELRGTGFNIKPEGLIVTNRHLVENAISIVVLFPGQKSYKADNWSIATVADLAVIALPGENLPVVALEDSLPAIGEEMTIIGNPLNFIKVVMRGEVTNYWQVNELPQPLLEINAPVMRGSSGSPVFNGDGRAAAVIFATLEGADGGEIRGLALPVALLQGLL